MAQWVLFRKPPLSPGISAMHPLGLTQSLRVWRRRSLTIAQPEFSSPDCCCWDLPSTVSTWGRKPRPSARRSPCLPPCGSSEKADWREVATQQAFWEQSPQRTLQGGVEGHLWTPWEWVQKSREHSLLGESLWLLSVSQRHDPKRSWELWND